VGKAERRKGATLEIRIANAQKQAADATATILARQKLIQEQEVLALQIMVWWQFEMSAERYELVQRYWHKRRMKTAAIHSVLAGTLYAGMGAVYDRRRNGGRI
jgi:hypothetical protein